MWAPFPPPQNKQFSDTSLFFYNVTQIDTICLKIASDLTRRGLSLTRLSITSSIIDPQVTQNFCLTWLQIRGSHDLLLFGFDYLLEQLKEPGKHILIKDLIKDMMNSHTERSIERGL